MLNLLESDKELEDMLNEYIYRKHIDFIIVPRYQYLCIPWKFIIVQQLVDRLMHTEQRRTNTNHHSSYNNLYIPNYLK